MLKLQAVVKELWKKISSTVKDLLVIIHLLIRKDTEFLLVIAGRKEYTVRRLKMKGDIYLKRYFKWIFLFCFLYAVVLSATVAAEEGNIAPGAQNSFFYNSSGFINAETYHGETHYDSNESFIEVVGAIAREDMKCSGILASVTTAQAILESGFGTTGLATEAHNLFGIKALESGNNWENSTWDGESTYRTRTAEQTESGYQYYIMDDFRAYSNIVDSVGDHSSYLVGATNGDHYRYDGLQYCTDYRTAATIIKAGGYATDVDYIDKLCSVIEQYDLTRFDQPLEGPDKAETQENEPETAVSEQEGQ